MSRIVLIAKLKIDCAKGCHDQMRFSKFSLKVLSKNMNFVFTKKLVIKREILSKIINYLGQIVICTFQLCLINNIFCSQGFCHGFRCYCRRTGCLGTQKLESGITDFFDNLENFKYLIKTLYCFLIICGFHNL